MKVSLVKNFILAAAVFGVMFGACTGGGDDAESKFAKALSEVNSNWFVYEVTEERGTPVIKVEVSEIVSFKDGKKAVEAISKADPKWAGYIDFQDSKTGTVVRKMEVIPAT